MDKASKRQNVVEGHTISIDVEARVEACGKSPTEGGVIRTGNKVYRPLLPYTYKETEFLEDFNDRMEWVFREYGGQSKE